MIRKTTILAIALLSVVLGEAQPVIDADFGDNGHKILSNTPYQDVSEEYYFMILEAVSDIALQDDGKIILTGGTGIFDLGIQPCVLRLNPDGSLDETFANLGIYLPEVFTATQLFTAVALQPDGKIVLACSRSEGELNAWGESDFALVRLLADGTPDPAFGVNGMVTTDFDNYDDHASAIVLQSDGKILVGGTVRNNTNQTRDFGFARYNTDGTLDTDFGIGGKVSLNLGNSNSNLGSIEDLNAIAIRPDGKILAVGRSDAGFEGTLFHVALARLNPDGTLDTSFGVGGIVVSDFGYAEAIRSLVLTPDNNILIGGAIHPTIGTSRIMVAKYLQDGALDFTFGTDGKVITQASAVTDDGLVGELLLRDDGKILATGFTGTVDHYDFCMVQYNPDGSLDNTFDTDGILTTDFGSNEGAYCSVLTPDGKIIAAGQSDVLGYSAMVVARYTLENLSDHNLDENHFSVYPNPFENQIGINFNLGQTENVAIDLHDIMGRKIKNVLPQTQLAPGTNSINIDLPETLSKGMYLLILSNGKNTSAIKIIK